METPTKFPPWYKAEILADSISSGGKRLTTFLVTYPRFIHSEIMTHRLFSRNAASSRAIPVEKIIERVVNEPAMPIFWGSNKPGMQAGVELEDSDLHDAKVTWLSARDKAVEYAQSLIKLGLHKQLANRLLEPWMPISVIISATEWENFFHLRCHPDAMPEFQVLAFEMRRLYLANRPQILAPGMWHLPLIQSDESVDSGNPCACDGALDDGCWLCTPERHPPPAGHLALDVAKKVSTARCARISYLTHDGKRDIDADLKLCDRLAQSGHWSPFEHIATPLQNKRHRLGNFVGWKQFRKEFENEHAGDIIEERATTPVLR